MPTAFTEAPIDVAHLAKRYGDVDAVSDVSLRVERGTIFGFLGPNGAGKTTCVKLLLGLASPTAGGGTVLGRPLGDRAARARIGYLPELFRYHDWMTAREELGFHAGLIGIERSKRGRAIDEVLETIGLSERADRRIGTYSKGMQQRVGLGVALLGSPDLIVLDEPTSALDPIGRIEVREILRSLKARGTTVFLNSHLLGEVELLCDRVAIVDRGRIAAAGPTQELVGVARGVRLKASPAAGPLHSILTRFGIPRDDGDWIVVDAMTRDDVPKLVRELVAAGIALHAIEPLTATLEERFIEVLQTR
ncbi:MAG TPA: ABC transporter ATP-binding protein [Candidatus Lustribacter sp.]